MSKQKFGVHIDIQQWVDWHSLGWLLVTVGRDELTFISGLIAHCQINGMCHTNDDARRLCRFNQIS